MNATNQDKAKSPEKRELSPQEKALAKVPQETFKLMNNLGEYLKNYATVGQKIEQLFKLNNITNLSKFAKEYKFPGGRSMIYQHIQGIRPVSLEAALIYQKGLHCKIGDFSKELAAQAQKIRDTFDELNSSPSEPVKEDDVFFDVLDIQAACGTGIVNSDYPEVIRRLVMPTEKALELIGSSNKNGQIRVIVAAKDSMLPTIKPNDLLFVDTSVKDFAGEAVYILLHGGELICKRLQLLGKNLTVTSDNKNYDSWLWNDKPEETQIIGKVLRALPLDFKIFWS